VIIKGTRWGSSATSSTLVAIESAGEEEEEGSGEEVRKIGKRRGIKKNLLS